MSSVFVSADLPWDQVESQCDLCKRSAGLGECHYLAGALPGHRPYAAGAASSCGQNGWFVTRRLGLHGSSKNSAPKLSISTVCGTVYGKEHRGHDMNCF